MSDLHYLHEKENMQVYIRMKCIYTLKYFSQRTNLPINTSNTSGSGNSTKIIIVILLFKFWFFAEATSAKLEIPSSSSNPNFLFLSWKSAWRSITIARPKIRTARANICIHTAGSWQKKKEKSPRKCKMICLPWKITLLHFLNPSTSLETKAITQLWSCMDRIWQNYRTKRKGKGYLNYTTKNAPLVTQFNLPEI